MEQRWALRIFTPLRAVDDRRYSSVAPQPMHEVKFVPFCNGHFLRLANLSNERYATGTLSRCSAPLSSVIFYNATVRHTCRRRCSHKLAWLNFGKFPAIDKIESNAFSVSSRDIIE
ncbi:hypothetical protein FNAPI_8975 [Fusarium napiforme]|uniref:Uncharacterized protein n=1 Tax=Fusarium napiforme TaxID=42672 RepID=A0A8H5J0W9_9HYPO|nr:hypothetical protein FNAPI_8975 [Fusarium napiforme]